MAIIDYENNLHRDTNVLGDNVYYGDGQGCRTIWYRSVEHFGEVIKKLGRIPEVPKELCLKCKGHYSYGSKDYKKYPDFNCEIFKKNVVVIEWLNYYK